MQGVELKPGQVVELELAKSEHEVMQFRTLVEERRSDSVFILLAPMYKSMPYPFHSLDEVDVIFTVHDEDHRPHVFSFRARTEERLRRGDLTYLRIVRLSEVRKLQRRGFYRLNYVADMTLHLLNEAGEPADEPQEITTRDISAGGLRGIVSTPLESGAEVLVHVTLEEEAFSVRGRVVSAGRMEGSHLRNEVRIEFVGLSNRETGHLIQTINRVQSEYIRRMAGTALEDRLALYGHDELLFTERRKSRDWVLRWLDWSVVITWLMTFLIIVNFLRAMPERANIIDYYYGYPLRLEWDMTIIQGNIYLLLALFVLTSGSIVLNATRMKREGDHYRSTLIVMAVLCLVMLLIYMLVF